MAVSLYSTEVPGLPLERFHESHRTKLTRLFTEDVPKKPRETSLIDVSTLKNLFNTCLRSTTTILSYQLQLTRVQKARLTEIHGNLCLWKDNLSDHCLELCLSYSTDLHQSILDLLCNIGKTVLKVLDITTESTSLDNDHELRTNLSSLELKRMLINGTDALASLDADDPMSHSDSDDSYSDSESESDETNDLDQLNSLLCSLQKLTRLLMDTCPTLEQTFQHILNPVIEIKAETADPNSLDAQDYRVLEANKDPPINSITSQKLEDTSGEVLPLLLDQRDSSTTLTLRTVQSPTRRKRVSKPKSKNGCSTCKIRHVKCDEEKPACYRCISTGRKCDGYDDKTDKEMQPAISDQPLSSIQSVSLGKQITTHGTVQEQRIFEYFSTKTLPVLQNSEPDFWQLVLRTSTQESVIYNAIIALGALHEDYQARSGRYDASLISEPSYQRSLQLYGRALRQLNGRLADIESSSPTLSIICSILFTYFEVLRRNDMTSIVHYRAGMRELMRQISLQENSNRSKAKVQSMSEDEFEVMVRVFARHDLQTYTFTTRKDRVEPLKTEIPTSPPRDLNLLSVRQHLDHLLIAAYQLIGSDNCVYRYWDTASCPQDWLTHVDQALETIQRWHHALEAFLGHPDLRRDTSFLKAKSLLGLRLQLIVAIIRLKTLINSGPETTFDRFTDQFESIVSDVEDFTKSHALVDSDPLSENSTPFMMELGVVYPLFFTAYKSRTSKLRRRAIAQLKKVGKEGLWEGPIMAVVAKRMMQIEEKGLPKGRNVPERNRIHKIKHYIDYDGRKVVVEFTLAQDETWKRWEVIRDTIPF